MPVPTKTEPERLDLPRVEPLRSECAHFAQCLRDGVQPLTDGREELRVLKILKAAQQSLDNLGNRVFLGRPTQSADSLKSQRPLSDLKQEAFRRASLRIVPVLSMRQRSSTLAP